MYTPTWDCEYGNYKDMNNEYSWHDDFFPTNRECRKANDEYREREREIIKELAEGFGLTTDEWDDEDYEIFIAKVGLY